MNIFFESEDSQKYFDVIGLQERITNKIGVTIPIPVLRNSIKALSRHSGQDVVLELYQKGDYFVIRKNWDATTNVCLEEQADIISARFRELNLYFVEFLKTEHLTSNKEFVDFFLTYAEDVSNYINALNTVSEVNEDFVNIIRFIQWLKEEKPDSFQIVNNLMWGAIIAGFLQRQNIETDIKVVEKVDYYLDTSLVLSILNLDSEENILYAKDLLRIIKDSGSKPCVHALTIREITRILSSVEASQGPKPGTSIEHAWVSQGLSLSTLLHIKNNLEKMLQDLGIYVKYVTTSVLNDIEKKYKNNFDVKALAEERQSIGEDRVREIHDVFMRDFVNKLNLDKGGAFIENQIAYFVSLNSDLITFASRPGIIPSVIHASKVIMSLWIHSSRSENVQKELLAEVMSRCFALNQTDVRHKLRLFQRHYKDCSLTKEDISHMYTSLIKRSANTINEVDKLSPIEASDQDDKDIISREIICGVIAAANKENADLNTAMLSMQAGMESLKHKVEEMSKIVEEVNFAKDSQGSIIKQYEADINLSHETIDGLKNEIKIYKRIVEIESLINTHKGKLHTFAEERKASVRLFKYWFNIVYECVVGVLFILFLITTIIHWNPERVLNIFSIGTIITLIGLSPRFRDMYILSPIVSKMKIRKEQEEIWDEKHPEYIELKKKILELEQEKKSIQMI